MRRTALNSNTEKRPSALFLNPGCDNIIKYFDHICGILAHQLTGGLALFGGKVRRHKLPHGAGACVLGSNAAEQGKGVGHFLGLHFDDFVQLFVDLIQQGDTRLPVAEHRHDAEADDDGQHHKQQK